MSVSVVTYNDQFTDKVTDAPRLMRGRDVGLFQEVKNTRLRDHFSRHQYAVFQGHGDGAQGVAVVWDYRKFNLDDLGRDLLLPATRGVKMEPRWIIWADLTDDDGQTRRYASTHRPPWRFRRRCPEYDAALAAWIEKSPYPVVIGMDANRRRGPKNMPRSVKWYHRGIDGFLVSRSLNVTRRRQLPWMRSDHRAYSATISDRGRA